MARPRRHLHVVDGSDEVRRGRGRPGKSLEQHVADATFRRRLHEDLLVTEPLVADPDLKKLQQRYRRLKTEAKRLEVSLEFERLVVAGAPDRTERDLGEFEKVRAKLGKPRSAEQAINFFERFFVWDDGSPWRLDDWQKDFLRELHRRDRKGRRIYQEILLGICRGQGKTPIASGTCVASLALEDDVRLNAYQVAGSKLQASIGTGYATNWIDDSDLLGKVLRARAKSVSRVDGRGAYTVLSSDGRLAHGRHGRIVAVADELWLFRTDAEVQAYVALESTLIKDEESFLLGISTAGYNKRSLLGRKYRRGLACPKVETRREGFLTIGRDEESGFLMWWYGMPEGYELDLENDAAVLKALRLANPGSWTIYRAQLRSLRRAMNGTVEEDDEIQDELEWLRLCLNYWTVTRGSWLKPGTWRALADAKVVIPRGADIYVAVDAAHSYDTTAVSWSWYSPELQKVVTRAHVFSVRKSATAHTYVDDFYDARGDRHVAERFIHEELVGKLGLRVREVVGDPNYFGQELARLGERFLTAPVYPQSNDMRDYVQRFYRDAHGHRIVTDGDQVVTAHVEAIVGEKTSDGYWAIKKRNNPDSMDAGTATIISNGRAQPDRRDVSVYEKRGLVVLGSTPEPADDEDDETARTSEAMRITPELRQMLGLDDDLDELDDEDDDLDDDFDLDDDEDDNEWD